MGPDNHYIKEYEKARMATSEYLPGWHLLTEEQKAQVKQLIQQYWKALNGN